MNEGPPPSGRVAKRFVGSAEDFAEMARSLAAEPTVQATLQRIVELAVENVVGCDGAGILLVHKSEIVAGSWSSDLVRQIETLEYELGEGPCIDAIGEQAIFESSDLRDSAAQWPRFTPRALDAGIESMLGFRLFAAEDTLGSLDLYGYRRGAFDDASRALGTVLAAHASMALAGAQVHESDLDTISGLSAALVARDVIGQAKGILMASRHVDAGAAFDLLVAASQKLNVKVRDLADDVARTGELPE
jgi:transcriptional regulator with GAF, ATPase, and Fis domain